mgnify:CR=1 FL=1
MGSRPYSTRSILTFFLTVILLSAVAETVICTGGSEGWYIVLMWLPAVAAAIISRRFKRGEGVGP